MKIEGKVYCFFEQSGTFKNEFKKLGYEAEDFDIQNEFGETDNVIDLFNEIETEYDNLQATGNRQQATGNCSGASATGDYSGASATGYKSGASATGYKSGASAGKGSVALSVGRETRAKGAIGSWIVLTECHHDDESQQDFIDLVRVAKVDGKRIKADTWYTLKDGKFVKAKDKDYE